MNITEVELKKEITSAEARSKYLESILGTNEIKDSYTNANYKNFNKLSEDNYNNRRIETYTNWLLKGSMDKDEQYSYTTLTDKQYNDAEKPKRFIAKGEGNTEEQKEAQENKLKTNGIQYKSNAIKVTPLLIKEDSELGEVLRGYQPLRELLSHELQKIKKGEPTRKITIEKDGELIEVPLSYKMVREHLGEVNADMKLSITKLKGLDGLRPTLAKVYENKLDMIDYSNWMHIKKIVGHIWLKEIPMNEDDIILVADVNRALEALKLSALDSDIIEKYNEGWTIQDIGREVNLHHSNVSRRIDKVCKFLSEYLVRCN
ncbi:hypothetical protein [Clostridium paraputrificum]|uniref:hypothetical protein n=1 Tax=Clostridium paraputrificum TaxID=29363 RepID=UPI000DCFA36E|nr:hypothetical protein [Clostridium paraputrificum]MDB2115664.1 hypothetical protein [Clostridium paraputrificum]